MKAARGSHEATLSRPRIVSLLSTHRLLSRLNHCIGSVSVVIGGFPPKPRAKIGGSSPIAPVRTPSRRPPEDLCLADSQACQRALGWWHACCNRNGRRAFTSCTRSIHHHRGYEPTHVKRNLPPAPAHRHALAVGNSSADGFRRFQ